MYTLEQLRDKNLNELKEIGWELNVFPAGDRRCRQNWIDAIAGTPPLLALLEVSPGVEVESVAEAIEVQAQEPIEIQAQKTRFNSDICWVVDAEDHFVGFLPVPADEYLSGRRSFAARPGDRVVEPGSVLIKPIEVQHQEPIAPAVETSPGVESCTEADRPPNRGDNGRGRIESESKLSQSAIGFCASPMTFSPKFLATYPPYFGGIHYKADCTGQLNLLEPETEDEPPDPDDFEGDMFAFWAAYDAWCERTDDDSEQFEPLEVSMASMCEWAPCPLEWYEPETNETIETVSCTLEISSMLELPSLFESCANESSSTCNFSIPTFDAWCDRPNGKDEPPTAGVGARLPKPKPPSFPPASVAEGDRSSIKQFARSAILLSGRAPPGGDAMS